MTRLSDTQATILAAAAQRSDGNLLPLPGSLRGGAAAKVVGALLTRGLAREEATEGTRKADTALNAIWRNGDDGRGVLLRITPAGLDAVGVDREPAGGAGTAADTASVEAPAKKRGRPKKAAPVISGPAAPRKTRDGSKQAQLIAMLRRKEGATIAQIVEATGWQPHTVRGAFAGALKKRLGLTVTSEKVEGVRVYRLPI